jgi:hypothetical protein
MGIRYDKLKERQDVTPPYDQIVSVLKTRLEVLCDNLRVRNTEKMLKEVKDFGIMLFFEIDRETFIDVIGEPCKSCLISSMCIKEEAQERYMYLPSNFIRVSLCEKIMRKVNIMKYEL